MGKWEFNAKDEGGTFSRETEKGSEFGDEKGLKKECGRWMALGKGEKMDREAERTGGFLWEASQFG